MGCHRQTVVFLTRIGQSFRQLACALLVNERYTSYALTSLFADHARLNDAGAHRAARFRNGYPGLGP